MLRSFIKVVLCLVQVALNLVTLGFRAIIGYRLYLISLRLWSHHHYLMLSLVFLLLLIHLLLNWITLYSNLRLSHKLINLVSHNWYLSWLYLNNWHSSNNLIERIICGYLSHDCLVWFTYFPILLSFFKFRIMFFVAWNFFLATQPFFTTRTFYYNIPITITMLLALTTPAY